MATIDQGLADSQLQEAIRAFMEQQHAQQTTEVHPTAKMGYQVNPAEHDTLTGAMDHPGAFSRFGSSFLANLTGKVHDRAAEDVPGTVEQYGRNAAGIATPVSLAVPEVGASVGVPMALRALTRVNPVLNAIRTGNAAKAVIPLAGATAAGLGINSAREQLNSEDAQKQTQGQTQVSSSPLPVAAKPTSSVQNSAQLAGLQYPEHDQDREMVQPTVVQSAQSSEEADPSKYTGEEVPETLPTEQVGPAIVAPTRQTEDQQVLAAIHELLSGTPLSPVKEETPGSAAVMDEVTKPREKSKVPETAGHKFRRFIVAGSGPVDFTRIDRQEAALRRDEESLTDKEKLKAGLAASDIEGARSFNRQSQLKREDTGGITDRDKLNLGVLMDQYKMAGGDARMMRQLEMEHQNKMKEMGASANAQKLTPAMQQQTALYSAAEKNPDIFSADQLQQIFGVRPSPQALEVLQQARLKDNPMTIMLSQILQEKFNQMNQAKGGTGKPIAIRSLSEKTPTPQTKK